MSKYFLIFIPLLFACTQKTVFDQAYDFGKKGWHTDSIVDFTFAIFDTSASHFLELSIRHTLSYEYQNLILFTHLKNFSGKTITDTIEYLLSDKNGRWQGKGIGNIIEVTKKNNDSIRFLKQGEYKIEIEQAMRYGKKSKIELLEGVLSVGICIKKH